jgi:16S rRNA (uracil1498-N3)-methyltransferase
MPTPAEPAVSASRLRLFVGPGPDAMPDARPDAGSPLAPHREFDLPATAARHAQVRRVQPGDALTVFDGSGAEWPAEVRAMGRGAQVTVRLGPQALPDDEAAAALPGLHVALVMPAGDRMDFAIEKATELGAASVQPLTSERSVLRLAGERAEKKREHWQALAVAASEQCGRRRVPTVQPVQALVSFLASPAVAAGPRWLLSPRAETPLADAARALSSNASSPWVLSGPEGGFSPAEEAAATAAGWQPVHLGPRVLRADTAPLAVLAWWVLRS